MNLVKALVLTVLACSLLWSQISFVRQDGVQNLPSSSWRFWDDMTLAIARFIDVTAGKDSEEQEDAMLQDLVGPYRRLVEDKVENDAIKPYQFWRKINDRKFRLLERPYSAPRHEDPGRSLLLFLGFRAFGGVTPYLLLWLGALAFIPALFWINHEFVSNGMSAAAVTLATLISFSPFWVECLSLPHSAVAFYLGALVALAAFSLAVFLPRRTGPLCWKSVAARAAFLSAILIVAIWCRSGSVFFVPAAFAVACIGLARGGLPRARAVLASAILVIAPVTALRPHQIHNVWLSIWEGLGDFGTDHGYSWYDVDANRFLAERGVPGFADPKAVTDEHEKTFKRALVAEVKRSPVWYAGVLLKRFGATVGLTHLDPYGPRDGESRRTPLFHYKYTTPLDWFGWKDRAREVPVSALYLPTLLLLLWGALKSAAGRTQGELAVLAVLAFATLPVPVLISTASGLETQAFGLVYFLGAALLVQRATDTLMNRLKRA